MFRTAYIPLPAPFFHPVCPSRGLSSASAEKGRERERERERGRERGGRPPLFGELVPCASILCVALRGVDIVFALVARHCLPAAFVYGLRPPRR